MRTIISFCGRKPYFFDKPVGKGENGNNVTAGGYES